MKTFFAGCLSLLLYADAISQFKNDNVLFKTIDPFELCKALEKSPGYLLLDVRSKGEYADTSSGGLNIGRFKNAVNINVRELGQRLHELDAYKARPVFVYCSHSQRSRRAGKMLADSGFTNVNNINGGVTSFHYLAALDQNCLQQLFETKNNFTYISPAAVCKKMETGGTNIFILDTRPDSAFRHISKEEGENALGYLKGTVNIPLDSLQNNFSKIPAGKEVIITDIENGRAAKAGQLLAAKGYKNLQVLIEGIDRWVSMDPALVPCKESLYVPSVKYNLLPVAVFGQWERSNKQLVVVDIRTDEEFTNRHKDYYRNIGHIKNAIHVPAAEIEKRLPEISNDKNTPVVLYGFGGGNEPAEAAALLIKNNFKNVNILWDGIFGVRWMAGNIAGYKWMNDLIADVPEQNK